MFDWRRLKPLRPHQIFFIRQYRTIRITDINIHTNQIKSTTANIKATYRINNQLPPSVVLHNIIMKSILITTGATITFESLIQIIVSPQFLNNLIRLKSIN